MKWICVAHSFFKEFLINSLLFVQPKHLIVFLDFSLSFITHICQQIPSALPAKYIQNSNNSYLSYYYLGTKPTIIMTWIIVIISYLDSASTPAPVQSILSMQPEDPVQT